MNRNQQTKIRKRKLFAQQNGLCFWCREQMQWLDKPVKGKQPLKSCTTDHLRDRFDPGAENRQEDIGALWLHAGNATAGAVAEVKLWLAWKNCVSGMGAA